MTSQPTDGPDRGRPMAAVPYGLIPPAGGRRPARTAVDVGPTRRQGRPARSGRPAGGRQDQAGVQPLDPAQRADDGAFLFDAVAGRVEIERDAAAAALDDAERVAAGTADAAGQPRPRASGAAPSSGTAATAA